MNEQQHSKSPLSITHQNLFWSVVISIAESFQLLVWYIFAKALFLCFFQSKAFFVSAFAWDPFCQTSYFRFFVLSVIGLQVLWVRLTGRDYSQNSLKRLAGVESFLAALLALSMTQIFLGNEGIFNKILFISSLAATVPVKIFWNSIYLHWDGAFIRLKQLFIARPALIALDGIVIFLLVSVLYMPDFEGVKAIIYSIDKLYHFDSFVMSPAWAYLNGFVINMDTQSIYGCGIPVVLGRLAQWIGGFSYENVIKVMTAMVILYGIGFYALLRLLSRDIILSLLGISLFISWQIFNVDPYILVWPNRTPVRFFFDVALLLFLFFYSRRRRNIYLALAAVTTGVSSFYAHDNGIYQIIVFYSYVLYLFLSPNQRFAEGSPKKLSIGLLLLFLLPPATFLLICGQSSGWQVLRADYWGNIISMLREFCVNGALPFYDNLAQFRFGKFFMGCLIVSMYLITLVYLGTLDFLKKTARENVFLIALSVYGLCLFQYYVWRSSDVNYLIGCGPFILLLVFWLGELKEKLKPSARVLFSVMILAASIAVIGSNENFRRCPNLLSGGRISLENNKMLMTKTLDISEDAALIKRLTRADGRVCLISSFDTAILIEAERKPFFYHAPLLRSTFFFDRNEAYGSANFFRNGDRDTGAISMSLDRLRQFQPSYVFVDKRILAKIGNVPLFYKPGYFLTEVTDYLMENYHPAPEQGKYLFVLKRR